MKTTQQADVHGHSHWLNKIERDLQSSGAHRKHIDELPATLPVTAMQIGCREE